MGREGSSARDAGPAAGKKRTLLAVLGALVLGAAALAGLGQAADFDELGEAFGEASPLWLLGCVVGQVLAYAGYIVGYHSVARGQGGPDFGYLTATKVVAYGFGAQVVASGAGSLAVDFWALRRAGEKTHAASRRVLALNTIEWMVLGVAAASAAVAVLADRGGEAPLAMTLAWIVGVPLALAALLWVTAPSRRDRLGSLPDGPQPERGGRSPSKWGRWLVVQGRKGLADVMGGAALARDLVLSSRTAPGAVPGFAVYWAGDLVTVWSALHAFGETVGLAALILAYATGYVVAAAPLPVGASGAAEAAMAASLHALGIPLAPAVLAAFLYRGFTFWLPIGPALLALPALSRLNDELPGVGRAPAAR